jgi:hypothetical protein
MPLEMSAEQVKLTRQLLVAKGIPSPVADEVIEIIDTELSKEDDADAAKTKLQKIADNLARQTLGASANPDKIANQGKENYTILLWLIGEVVRDHKSIIEEVAGGLGEVVRAFRGLFKDIGASEPHAQQPNTAYARLPPAHGTGASVGPADTDHPIQPSGHHTPRRGHHTSEHHPTRRAGVHCSFCGKSQSEIRKLIAGPSVLICNECVVSCCTTRPSLSASAEERSWYRQNIASQAEDFFTTRVLWENCQCCSFCGKNHPYLMKKPISDPLQPISDPPVFICKQCMKHCGHIIFSAAAPPIFHK